MQVVRVSGTIKKAEQEAIRRARLTIQRAQRSTKKGSLALSTIGGSDEAAVGGAEDADVDMGFENGIEDVEEEDDDEDDEGDD